MFANSPADETIDCTGTIPSANVSATDDCDTDVEVVMDETTVNGNCPGNFQIIRTWTATDDCGNIATQSQTITVEDTVAPVISGIPANTSASCDFIPQPANPTATDNCSSDVSIVYNEQRTELGCPGNYILTRTWTANDGCGNESVGIQTITVEDTSPPILLSVPNNQTINCDEVATLVNPIATDNCDNNPFIDLTELIIPGPCDNSYQIRRTWTATDNCGNTDDATQVITVVDDVAPILVGIPADIEISCESTGDIPAPSVVTATDNCDNNPTVTLNEETIAGTCNGAYTIIRTWIATDECGNESTGVQEISIGDQTPPTIDPAPADITAECGNVPAAGLLNATDNCGSDVTVTVEDTNTEGICLDSYTITRTWTATDGCGNTSTTAHTITVEDTTPPVILGIPANVVINEATGDTIPPVSTDISATDNCDTEVDIDFSEITEENGCGTVVFRTWTATDNCNNTSQQTQTITISGDFDISITPSQPTICANDPIQLSVIADETPISYQWSADQGSFDDPTGATPFYTGNLTGNINVNIIVTTASGCVGVATTNITVNPTPDTEVFANGPLCEGQNITLFASGGNAYQWSGPDGFTADIQNPVIPSSTPINSGDYAVTITNVQGCTSVGTVNVSVNDRISADFSAVHADCQNLGSIVVGVIGGTGNYTFTWDPNNGTSNVQPFIREGLVPDIYNVTVTDDGGCSTTISNILVDDRCANGDCVAEAGNLTIEDESLCGGDANNNIVATPNGNMIVPPGFEVIYILTETLGNNLVVVDTSSMPDFNWNEVGNFTIHTLIYDPATLDLDFIDFDNTSLFEINSMLTQGGGDILSLIHI